MDALEEKWVAEGCIPQRAWAATVEVEVRSAVSLAAMRAEGRAEGPTGVAVREVRE